MSYVCILDYGSGNVKSVHNLFSAVAERVIVSNSPSDIQNASHIVLPGVGAFGSAMRKIQEALPMDILTKAVLDNGKPFLGICVGMQVLAEHGKEFGEHAGLGWIPGTVEKLEANSLPLPHIGWNNIECKQPSPLFSGLEHGPDFYFLHSFAFHPSDTDHCVATATYGEEFCSAIQRGNLYGVQFHPEKSQRAGTRLVKNFLSIAS